MRGYAEAHARYIFRDLFETQADVPISAREVHVRFDRRTHLPMIIAYERLDTSTKVHCWTNRSRRMSAQP